MNIIKASSLIGLTLVFIFFKLATVNAKATKYIFAAASTRNVVDALITAFPKNDDVKFLAVYGATSALARQIIDGAPASLFLSANRSWMNEIIKAGLVEQSKNVFANRLVVISPKDMPLPKPITKPAQIIEVLKNERLAVAEITAVPAGIYSRQALMNLKIWGKVSEKLAQSTNVRAALALVERSETPLGLVYRTDAFASPYVKIIWKIPEKTHEKIVYPLALLKTAKHADQTQLFYSFFFSETAREIFSKFAFEVD